MPRGKLFSQGRVVRERQHSSKKQEKGTAVSIHGSRVSGSGSKWFAKGDAKSERFLVECKRTDDDSIRIKKTVFAKIKIEALMSKREPVMQLEIGDVKLAVMEWDLFLEMAVDNGIVGES